MFTLLSIVVWFLLYSGTNAFGPDDGIRIQAIDGDLTADRGKKKMDKLCKARRSVARSKRELRAILERMIKECEKGYIVATPDVMHYTLNLLCVPKKKKK
eukprot:213410_1